MDLVALLDSIKLPLQIPLLAHPPLVHFAVVLPVVALLLEIGNLTFKRRCIGVISGLLLTLAAIVYLAAFFSGKTDGSEAYALLGSDGKEELKEHKLLGIYLVYGAFGILLLKLIFMMIQKFWAKALFTLLLAGFVAAAFIQGKHGGELVYKYGANVKAVSDMDDKIMDLEDQIDTLKAKKQECESKLKSLEQNVVTQPAPSTMQEPQTEPKPAPKSESSTEESSSEAQSSETQTSSEEAPPATEGISTIEQKAQEALEQIKSAVKHEANTTEQAH